MKKQIIIDGESSDWYEKAVFILKDKKETHIPDNLFLYAEHIVENHLKKNPMVFYTKTTNRDLKHQKKAVARGQMIDRFFNVTLIICGVSIIGVIALYYI